MYTHVLFLLKRREILPSASNNDWRSAKSSRSSGLYNSAIHCASVTTGAKVVEVIDANCIDREVTHNKPTVVILEALWVTPSKLKELQALHPKVKWFIRLHSEIPFLAVEGVALGWIKSYLTIPNVHVACNSKRITNALTRILGSKIYYLPNYYQASKAHYIEKKKSNVINISCFGAVRPMKNHLLQAIAAIRFANKIGKDLHFHINSTRREDNGDPVLNNLRSLFHLSRHKLMEHSWMDHDEFLEVVAKMDIGMQVSMSETFNIVTADHINEHVPVVVSKEVPIVSRMFKVDATSFEDIVNALMFCYYNKILGLQYINNIVLWWENLKAKRVWKKFLGTFL